MLFRQSNASTLGIETGAQTVRSGVIHYQAAGAGEPVALLHGLSGSGRWWQRNLAFMAKRFRVFTLDMIGFGRSRGQAFTLEQAHHAILDWMDRMQIERLSLVGHSMGGYVAGDLAANHPDRVNKIVLVNALALPMHPSLLRNAARLASAVRYMPLGFLPVLFGDALQAGPATLIKVGQQVLRSDMRAGLQRIHSPTLIVWGEKDPLLPLHIGEMIQMHLPQAELVVVKDAGHNPMWDKADEFNWAVGGFLKSGIGPALTSTAKLHPK